MKFLHVAIIEDYEECLASHSEEGLRKQVTASLSEKNIIPPTDEEWIICILAQIDGESETDNLSLGLISYYKIESKL